MRFVLGLILVFGALGILGGAWAYRPRPIDVDLRLEAAPQEGQFAVDSPHATDFDASKAMSYLEDICKIGPRISGTPGMLAQQKLIEKHFEGLGAKPEYQRFQAKQHSQRQAVAMANMIVSWHPERTRRVILCSHYDTRPLADQEDDRRNWRKPFVSANDGGSGVALLMELGRQMKDLKTQVGVDFVFFDGEEYIFEKGVDDYFLGSEHFASTYKQNPGAKRYVAAILLDMVGGKDAQFPIESHSQMYAGALVQQVYAIAADLKCTAFKYQIGHSVLDDHLALNKAGIPAIDIIDFDYVHWHRLSDVPANCSAESLGQVAKVLTVWLQRIR